MSYDPQQSPAEQTTAHTAAQALAEYASGNRTFAYWNLAGAVLRNADLRDANFYGAILRGADLSGADLTRCNFARTDLRAAVLRGANISQAYLDTASTDGADMSEIITDRPSAQNVLTPIAPTPATPVAAPTARFCAYCGSAISIEAAFCSSCGRPQPAPGVAAPASMPLAYASPALPSTPYGQPQGMAPAHPYSYGGYAPPSMPLQPAAYSTPLRPLAQQRASLLGVTIATICGAVAAISFFLPSYVSSGSVGASGPQVAGAFGTVASLCNQYSGYIQQSSSASSACAFASIAGPALWLEMLLAAVAAIVAGWQWYNARPTGLPTDSRACVAVLITGGISLLILVFQFLILPALVSASTGISALGQAVSAAFGFSFWLMVLGTIGVVVGAIMQLRAS